MQPIRLISGFLTVGTWTFLSRILGFVRDILIAAKLGDGPVAQAWVVAFSLPNMFRRFFAEGAFNMAFVPMFSKRVEKKEDAETFASEALSALASFLVVFTLAGQIAMPWLVLAMASGFLGDERFDLATLYGRIAFPYILFISIAALLSGALNAVGRFAAAAAAPVLLNAILIGAMLLAMHLDLDFGLSLVWAVPIAGVAQMALVWTACRRAGLNIRLQRPRLSPEIRELARIAAPAVLAGGVVQVNLLVGRQVASYADGAIQYLNLADRLYQLPLGVVAIAIGVVLLPDLSRKLASGDTQGGQHALSRAAEFALLFTLPAAVGLIVVAGPIVTVLYQHGAFGAEAAAKTAQVTAIYGAGLPAFVLQKVWQPLYFARHDTRTPFRFALVAMVANAVVAVGFFPVIDFYSAAWATTIAAWIMLGLLVWGARSMGPAARPDRRFRDRLWRIVLASAVMGGVVWALGDALSGYWTVGGAEILALAFLMTSAIVVYFGAAWLLGALRLGELRTALRRQPTD